jgi:hypothetical protein
VTVAIEKRGHVETSFDTQRDPVLNVRSDLLSLRDRAIGSLLSDGRTCIIKDQLVVTTLSYLSTELQKRPWLIKGNRLRTQTGLPWLVVQHYPPALYQSAGPEELSAGKLAREFEPTFWLSGRFYGEPYQKEFVWFQRINRTIVLNAAQYPTADRMGESLGQALAWVPLFLLTSL